MASSDTKNGSSPDSTERHDPYAALRIPDFRWLSMSRFTLTIGLQIVIAVVSWQVYSLTKDTLSLASIGLVSAIPALSVSLYAGHIADIHDRRTIMLICWWAMWILTGALFWLSFDMEALYPRFGVYPIYAVLMLLGFARGFSGPPTFALVSQIVPRHMLPNASTWNSAVWQTGAVAGPAVGGLLLGFVGIPFSYCVSFVLTGIALFSLYMVSKREHVKPQQMEPIGQSILTGVRFVFSNPLILSAHLLDLFAVFFGGAVALLPVFVQDILKSGPQSFGFLRAAPSIGAVVMGLFIAHRPLPHRAGKALLAAVAGFGLCMIAFALSRNFYLSFAILAVSGGFDQVSVVLRATILQVMTPDVMRGRVSAVITMFIGSSNEIGEAESGLAARLLGVVPSVIFGGCMTLVTVLITKYAAPSVSKLTERDLRHG